MIFHLNSHLQPHQFHAIGTAMLFTALERNSDLVYDALRFLVQMHTLHPDVEFVYERGACAAVDALRFDTVADGFLDDFLMTLYACAESPIKGVRPEALAFFSRWVRSKRVAYAVFVRIALTWPWTNRNKFYFLSLLCESHGFEELMREAPGAERLRGDEFVRGLSLSLQYRNLLSAGQTLAVTLSKQNVPEMFERLAWLLRDAPCFEAMNCLIHWMPCVRGKDRVFELLELDSGELLTASRFEYLRAGDFERLVMFRACFRKQFSKVRLAAQIDAICNGRRLDDGVGVEVAVKLAQLDVIIANTIDQPDKIVSNLALIAAFMRHTMHVECSAMRRSILKLVPNLLYLLAPMLRRPDVEPAVRSFFRTLRTDVFEAGLDGVVAYQPVIFATRLLEVMLRTLHGNRSDRIIKRLNTFVNARIVSFLDESETWPLLSESNYRRLFALLRSEFEDVRDIACELLARFFPANDIRGQCEAAVWHTDIHQCGYGKLLARVAIGFDGGSEWCAKLSDRVREVLSQYGQDPLRRMRADGGHLFGALDAMSVVYTGKTAVVDDIDRMSAESLLAVDVVDAVLDYLQFGGKCSDGDREADGSASFERMDESLSAMVKRSQCTGGESDADLELSKQWLLLSLWNALRAACDLASSIAVARQKIHKNGGEREQQNCYEMCTKILLQCRHKGAIESAGRALGRLVEAITESTAPDAPAYRMLLTGVHNVMAIVEKTDTTRRGAGLSIMVHQLVRADRHPRRPLLAAVMRVLLAQGAATQSSAVNRDNRQAAVLHILCMLVRDGELRTELMAYAAEIFALSMATIESREWTVRNAALQLFGAFVPKLVGQTQSFENELAWQPVYTVYGDFPLKQHALHEHLLLGLRQCVNGGGGVRLVMMLELLARVEVLEASEAVDGELRALFYGFLRSDSEKVRTLAARCLVRFHQWYEVEEFVRHHVRMLAVLRDANFRHGVVRTVEMMLLKWASDGRCMPVDHRSMGSATLFEEVRDRLLDMSEALASHGYFERCYVYDLMRLVGCGRRQAALLGPGTEESTSGEVARLRLLDGQRIGFDAWAEKVLVGLTSGSLIADSDTNMVSI